MTSFVQHKLSDERLQAARGAYAYPPVRLVISGESEPADVEWPGIVRLRRAAFDLAAWKRGEGRDEVSSVELDEFHRGLLNSDADADLLHGLASVQYWGNAWDPRGRPLSFAIDRTNWLVAGKAGRNGSSPSAQPIPEILQRIKDARRCVRTDNLPGALYECLRIRYIGMSFATKLIAFMDPKNAAIYDSAIEGFLAVSREPGHEHCRTSVKPTSSLTGWAKQGVAYAMWCVWCRERSDQLNEAGLRWRDWDGTRQAWRAIDVEHALFAIAKDADKRA